MRVNVHMHSDAIFQLLEMNKITSPGTNFLKRNLTATVHLVVSVRRGAVPRSIKLLESSGMSALLSTTKPVRYR